MSRKLTERDRPTKMIDFIKDLYVRFKILNKLSQKQSNDFQSEVVTMLVDSNEDVDQQTYARIEGQFGLQHFLLQTLGKVINRSPFKNQFELNRNLATITQRLKKEQDELQKKQKVLERKEEKVKAMEEQILVNIKQKILAMESESMIKIQRKENQIRKAIQLLLNQLKGKERIIVQKYESVKSNLKVSSQLEQKEKAINEKMKTLERREKDFKSKDMEVSMLKKETEVQEMRETNQKLKQNIREINKRYKNLQLAYRKLKNDCKTKQNQRNTEANLGRQQLQVKRQRIAQRKDDKNKKMDLDELQLSTIEPGQAHTCEQLVNHINHQQFYHKMHQIQKNLRNLIRSQKITECAELTSLKNLLSLNTERIEKGSSSEQQDSGEEVQLQCLIQQQQPYSSNEMDNLLEEISHLPVDTDDDKIGLIRSNRLMQLVRKCKSLNMSSQICERILQLMIELISDDEHYEQIIGYLSSAQIISFLQMTYLSHETNENITETTTLFISRIKLKNECLELDPIFVRAVQIRLKVQDKSSFLYGNIKSILS